LHDFGQDFFPNGVNSILFIVHENIGRPMSAILWRRHWNLLVL